MLRAIKETLCGQLVGCIPSEAGRQGNLFLRMRMELETAPGSCCRETILIARFVAVCIGVLPAGGACRAGHDHRDDSQVVGYGVSAAGGHYDSSWNLPSHIRPIFGGYYGDPYQGVGWESSSALRSSRAATWVRKPFNSRSICASAVFVCRSFSLDAPRELV